MPFIVTIERTRDFVRFDVAGTSSLKNFFDLIDSVAKEALAQRDRMALVDLRRVRGRLSFTDEFFIGDVVGRKLTHLGKLALLVAEDPQSYPSPKVAARMGVNIGTFPSEEEALGWLLESGPA